MAVVLLRLFMATSYTFRTHWAPDPIAKLARSDFVEHYQAQAVASAACSSSRKRHHVHTTGSTPASKIPASTPRVRETHPARHARIFSDDFQNAAMQGETLLSGGVRRTHDATVCKCRLPSAAPCWNNLWRDKAHYAMHLNAFEMTQEARSAHVFSKLQDAYYAEVDSAGLSTGPRRWHYFAPGGRSVCRDVFLLAYPIGESTLYKLKARIKNDQPYAHEKDCGKLSESVDYKTLSVIGWYLAYADSVGDWMPDDQELIVPRRDRHEEWQEYAVTMGNGHAAYSTFCATVKKAPELSHVAQARKVNNFQACATCVDLNENVKQACASHNPARISAAKTERAAHHADQRCERVCYRERAAKSRDPAHDSVSLILDKWDSAKSTCPFFTRSPGHWWAVTRKNVLDQHVLGILFHSPLGNEVFLYTFNDTISPNANSNIEGIRRALIHKYVDTPMPSRMDVQGDNASDNKNWTLIAWFAMLVHHGYTKEVIFSFLLVGHTHEDIDQLFSVLSRYLKRLKHVMTPDEFQECMASSMASRSAVVQPMLAVFDWSHQLRSRLVDPLPTGIQHTMLHGEQKARSPHSFWIHKRADGVVVLHYKERSAHTVWLPGLPSEKPTATNPEGIVLFAIAPPDPMVAPPSEVELCDA